MHTDGNLSIYMNQLAYVNHLLKESGHDGPNVNCTTIPHCQGYPVEKIPVENTTQHSNSNALSWCNFLLTPLTGCQYLLVPIFPQSPTSWPNTWFHPAKVTLKPPKKVICYLKGTQQLGISFHSAKNDKLHAFVKQTNFPLINLLDL